MRVRIEVGIDQMRDLARAAMDLNEVRLLNISQIGTAPTPRLGSRMLCEANATMGGWLATTRNCHSIF